MNESTIKELADKKKSVLDGNREAFDALLKT